MHAHHRRVSEARPCPPAVPAAPALQACASVSVAGYVGRPATRTGTGLGGSVDLDGSRMEPARRRASRRAPSASAIRAGGSVLVSLNRRFRLVLFLPIGVPSHGVGGAALAAQIFTEGEATHFAHMAFLDLIWKALRAGFTEGKNSNNSTLGTPQGSTISPIVANVYLHKSDCWVEKFIGKHESRRGARLQAGQPGVYLLRQRAKQYQSWSKTCISCEISRAGEGKASNTLCPA
jgi:hypothetical protein